MKFAISTAGLIFLSSVSASHATELRLYQTSETIIQACEIHQKQRERRDDHVMLIAMEVGCEATILATFDALSYAEYLTSKKFNYCIKEPLPKQVLVDATVNWIVRNKEDLKGLAAADIILKSFESSYGCK